jgi:transposase
MDKPIQFVGVDLHQDTVTVAVLPESAPECRRVVTLANDAARLRRFLRGVEKAGPIHACYEASSCGYVLQRSMTKWGIPCDVVAPSLIPKRPGDHVKTDRRDAVRLAHLYRAGELIPIRIPTEQEEQVRSMVRARAALTREIMASRHYILKLLQTRGHSYRAGANWTRGYWIWLRSLALEGEDAFTLGTYVELLEHKLALRQRIDDRLSELARTDPWKEAVDRLCTLRGVKTLTAMTLATEVGDIRRFPTARSFMAWLGLNVSEYSSGGAERRGGITKAGNKHCRRVLVEAAWHYRRPPRIGKELASRLQGQPEAVRLHALRAQRRLYLRFCSLERRKVSKVTTTAIARELAGFVWALMRGDEQYLAARALRN